MDLKKIVLDTMTFWKLITKKLHIEPYYQILIPSTVITDILHSASLNDVDIRKVWSKLKNYKYVYIDKDIAFEQFILKTELDNNVNKISDNTLNAFAIASKTGYKIFSSSKNHELLYHVDSLDLIEIK